MVGVIVLGCLLVSELASIRHEELGHLMKPEHIPQQDLGKVLSGHVIPARTELHYLAGTKLVPACFT